MLKDSEYCEKFMREALHEARKAWARNEVPVGAVVVYNNQVIGRGANQPITGCDPTAHAEIVAIRDAAKHLENYRLAQAELFVTVEPCTMCFGAIIHSRISHVVFGASEPKAGVIDSNPIIGSGIYNHTLTTQGGVLADECSSLMSDFFQYRREQKRALKHQNK